MKKKIHKLSGAGTEKFKLLGISSHENDYRLSWAINRQLDLDFRKSENFLVYKSSGKEPQQLEFSLFQHAGPDRTLKINLISNRCPDGFLIRELKNIDFFLQIFGIDNQDSIDRIARKLKSIEIVSTVFEIPQKIRKTKWDLPSE